MRHLVRWLRKNQEWERAFHILQRLDEAPALADLIIEAGPHLIRAGRIQLVDKWTDAIPHFMRDRWPELHAVRGVALVLLGNMKEGLALFDRAEEGLITLFGPDVRCPAMVRLSAWRAVTLRLLGDYEPASQESRAALALIDALPDEDRSLLEMRALIQKNIGLCYRGQGYPVYALEFLQRALELFEDLNIEQDVATLYMDIAVTQMGMGDIDDALAKWSCAATLEATRTDSASESCAKQSWRHLPYNAGQLIPICGEALLKQYLCRENGISSRRSICLRKSW